MATVRYTGNAATRAQVTTLTVGSSTVGHTFVTTLNRKAETYVVASGTTSDIATAIAAQLAAREEPDWREITFEASGSTIVCTGPDDGTPFTLSLSGTGTYSQATTSGTPSSPNDASIAANYSGNAVPSAADVLVFEGNDVSVKWGLTALAAIGLTVVRRASYGGQIGLPDWNPAGYPEYRTTHLQLKSASTTWESSNRDAAGQFRLEFVTSAVALVVTGDPSSANPGRESLEIKGMPASSTLDVNGGSVAVCPVAGQTGTLAHVVATSATVTVGAGTTVSLYTRIDGGAADLRSDPKDLLVRGGADVTVGGSVTTTETIDVVNGRVRWLSSGTLGGNVTIDGRGEFSADDSPGIVGNGFSNFTLAAQATLRDNYGKMSAYTIAFDQCTPQECTVELYRGVTLTL